MIYIPEKNLMESISKIKKKRELFRNKVDLVRDISTYIIYLNFDIKPPDLSEYGKRTEEILGDDKSFYRLGTTDLIQIFTELCDMNEVDESPKVIREMNLSGKEKFEDVFQKKIILKDPNFDDYIRNVDKVVIMLSELLANDMLIGERRSWKMAELWGRVAEEVVLVYSSSKTYVEILRRIAQYHTMKLGAVFPHLVYNIQCYLKPEYHTKTIKTDEMPLLIGTIKEYRNSYNGTWEGYIKQMDIFNRILIDYLQRYRKTIDDSDIIEYLFPDNFFDIKGERK